MGELRPRQEYEISGVRFTGDDAIVVDYMCTPSDVRNKGQVVLQKSVLIDGAKNRDYREDIGEITETVLNVLRSALEDFDETEPWVPRRDTGDDPAGEDDELGSAVPREG